jgi:hypothetical protein
LVEAPTSNLTLRPLFRVCECLERSLIVIVSVAKDLIARGYEARLWKTAMRSFAMLRIQKSDPVDYSSG